MSTNRHLIKLHFATCSVVIAFFGLAFSGTDLRAQEDVPPDGELAPIPDDLLDDDRLRGQPGRAV